MKLLLPAAGIDISSKLVPQFGEKFLAEWNRGKAGVGTTEYRFDWLPIYQSIVPAETPRGDVVPRLLVAKFRPTIRATLLLV